MEGTIPHQHKVEERLHLAPSLSRFEADYSIDTSLTSLMEGTILHQHKVEERLQLSQVELEQWEKT
jgi:hypothetical protein